jgi:uncharacterized protein involved in outer membrane biogenesis
LKSVVIILAALLILAGGGIAALYVLFPTQKIIALVLPQVEKAIGRKVAIEKAGITLYPALGISVSGLQVSNTEREGFSREPFIKVDRFVASISISSIFKGYPEIQEITIKRPQFRVEVDKAGKFNFDDLVMLKKGGEQGQQLPQAAGGRFPALPVPITLKKLAIENGSIVYDDKKAGNEVVIASVNQQAAIAIDRQLKDITTTGSLVLAQVSIKTKEIKKPLSNLSITVSHDIGANLVDGTVTVRQVRLSLQKFFITLKGTVKNALSPAPALDLAIVSDPMTVGDLLKEVPLELVPLAAKVSASGSVELGATVKGILAEGKPLPVRGELAIKNVTVKYADLPQSINNCNAAISFTDNSLAVNSLTMRFGTNPIEARAIVTDFKKPFVDAAIKADINLGEVKDIIKLPQGASLDGRIVGNITARGEADPSNPSKLDLKGTVDLKNLVVVWSPLIKPAIINGMFTLSSKAIGQNVAVSVGQSSLTMTATVSNYLSFMLPDPGKKLPRTTADFKCTSPLLDIDAIIKPPEPPKEGGARNADAPIIAPLPGIDMKGTVTTKKLIYKGFTMSNMVVKVSVVNDIADVDFATGIGGGSIGNKLHANLKNVNTIVFTNDLTVKSVEVNDLVGQFGEYIRPVTPLNRELIQINKCLFGRINLQSSINGSGGTVDGIMKSMAGGVGAQMAEGRIVNAPATRAMGTAFGNFLKTGKLGGFDVVNFRDLAAKIRLSNGRALFDDLKIRSDFGDVNAKGSVGFDALMDMAVSTRLSRAVSDNILKAENSAKNALKSNVGGTALAGLAGMLDKVNVIPRDKEGRVTLRFVLGGPVARPSLSSLAFGEGTAGGGSAAVQQPAPKQQVQQQVQQQAVQKKNEVKQELQKKTVTKLKGIFGR